MAPKVVLRDLEVRPTVITCVSYPPGHRTPVVMAVDHRLIDRALETLKISTFLRSTYFYEYPFLRRRHSTRTTIRVANQISIVSYV